MAREGTSTESWPCLANILVVSDLHFGEELLPGRVVERRHAIELGARRSASSSRYHTARRRDGRPWRLVIARRPVRLHVGRRRRHAGAPARRPPTSAGSASAAASRRASSACGGSARPTGRCSPSSAVRRRRPRRRHRRRQPRRRAARARGRRRADAPARAPPAPTTRALARIRVVPWFVYIPGVAWIEHGHVYDEGCSFEFNLAPMDPKDGDLIYNADYAAVRYLGTRGPRDRSARHRGVELLGLHAVRDGARASRSVRPAVDRATRGSWRRCSARAGCTARSSAATAAAASTARGSSRSRDAGGISLETAPRSIASRARR